MDLNHKKKFVITVNVMEIVVSAENEEKAREIAAEHYEHFKIDNILHSTELPKHKWDCREVLFFKNKSKTYDNSRTSDII